MSASSARTFLVTGAAGFIGSHTAIRLLERGDHVVGLDNFNDYYDPARKRANLDEVQRAAAAESSGNFTFVEGDIRDRRAASRSCSRSTRSAAWLTWPPWPACASLSKIRGSITSAT